MTEREEFELVAKAAKYEFTWMTGQFSEGPYLWSLDDEWARWNPKTDDGDSRRLQVDLGITVFTGEKNCLAENPLFLSFSNTEYFKDHPDKYAAVRAAVWDVAVEVAKRRMEE